MDEPNTPRADSELQKPLEHFRAKTKRLKVHPLEIAALWLVGAHLVFLPWALGAMRPWGQFTSLALALLGFVFALIPRNYTTEHTGSTAFRLITWPKLLRFPIFWLGLALLVLVTIQALNPAWVFNSNDKGWWMTPLKPIAWLPSGVAVPFERWGPWRMLIIYSSAWLTVCTIWVAFSRRRSVQWLLLTLAVNGMALAVFGIAQRLIGNGKMFWFWTSPNQAFFSSFIYKNHGGAYLNLTLVVTAGLAAWYYVRGLRRMEKSDPAGVFAFFATCIAMSILVSYARGATFGMLIFILLALAAFVRHQWQMPASDRRPAITITLILICGYFAKTGLTALGSNLAWDRVRHAFSGEDSSVESRQIATKAAGEMLGETWKMGTGAGSFRFLFPPYQKRYPTIYSEGGRRTYWEHAHNDILEIPIELGVPGMLLILASFGYWLVSLVRNFFWQNPLSSAIVAGCLLMVGHAWGEFVFQCPAILVTWCALWAIATQWSQMEALNLRS